jgi:hypothetical protein
MQLKQVIELKLQQAKQLEEAKLRLEELKAE